MIKAWLLLSLCHLASFSGDLQVQPESVFAVVTHKAGLLSNLGHNHFIYASKYETKLQTQNDDLKTLTLEFSLPVASLVVDDPLQAKKWFASIKEAGILDEEFSDVSEKDRGKITKSMLGKKQLKANKYPVIKAHIQSVIEKSGDVGALKTTHLLTLKVEICENSKTFEVPAAMTMADGVLHIRAIAPMKFSDFKIKPFSALLGSVANDDLFHLFVDLQAR